MKWILRLFRRWVPVTNGGVVLLDTDLLSKDDIARIKQRMTPVFVEFSGSRCKKVHADIRQAVTVA